MSAVLKRLFRIISNKTSVKFRRAQIFSQFFKPKKTALQRLKSQKKITGARGLWGNWVAMELSVSVS